MINTIIIDDEPDAISALRSDLEKHFPQIHILTTCTSGKAGLKAINELRPDLVFLDIDMPKIIDTSFSWAYIIKDSFFSFRF